ncbi:hypothetical protein GGI23_002057 [Coemansia sp. RSA 2559]|nr:hypothetical protein GGI23_002057 [Coemansia sp. RSA 2559]
MSGFFSGLFGTRAAAAEAVEKPGAVDSIIYDTIPRLVPPPGIHVDPMPGATAEEQAAVDAISSQRDELLRDLPLEPSDAAALFDADKWLDAQNILIYVRSTKGDTAKALQNLRRTLEWRRTYRPHAITPESMRAEASTGKQYVNGFDRGGRPIVYMYPHRQNTKDPQGNLRWVVCTMEQAIRSMPPAATKITIVIDVSKYAMAHAVPLSTAREFLHILEAHYPERLHKAFVVSPPIYFVMFYHIIAPFIDPVTKAKIAFVDPTGGKTSGRSAKSEGPWVDIFDHIAPECLASDVGGSWDFKFVQDDYWPELEKSYQLTLSK